MTGAPLKPKARHLEPPIRRVLAIDAGTRRIKLLLAQSRFGRFSILNQEMIDLQAEGLVSAEELAAHLQSTLDNFARPPLALSLPQHLSTSQVIELPVAPDAEIDKQIHDETLRLGGLTQSRIVYDFVRTGAHANRQRFWVTLSQEAEIRDRTAALGIAPEDLCDVTTTANALLAAFRHSAPTFDRAILVHLGAQSTLLAVLADGQPAFSASFPMGGDFLTRALARAHNSSEDAAEALKKKVNFFEGPDASAPFIAAVDGWIAELRRQLDEWFRDHPDQAAQAETFRLVVSGDGFDLKGLRDYAEPRLGRKMLDWPANPDPEAPKPEPGFEVALGTALQALGHTGQSVSLMPQDYRAAWNKRLWRQRLEIASIVVLAVCVLLLSLGTWHQFTSVSRKETLLSKVRSAREAVELNKLLTSELLASYESLRPVSAMQQNTLDTLRMLPIIQNTHSNSSYWYVLLADQATYFSQSPAFTSTSTNAPGTNTPPAAPERKPLEGKLTGLTTNATPARPGYIAEVSIPGDAEAARATLSRLVNQLKEQKLFSKVDLLSEDLRQPLTDPKVVLPERHFALALDFAQSEFTQPVKPKKPVAPLVSRVPTARRTSTQEVVYPR